MTRTIKASEFKAKCLKLIDEVAEQGEALVITKRGKPLVRVEPEVAKKPKSLLGCLKGQIEIVDPDDDLKAWDHEFEKAVEERLRRTQELIAPPRRRKQGR